MACVFGLCSIRHFLRVLEAFDLFPSVSNDCRQISTYTG
jgi:hypothetical protein